MAITSIQISSNLVANTIPGYPAEMAILKAYIYAKPWYSGNGNSYLTLFTMVPVNEFQSEVSMIEYKNGKIPRTHGIFVSTIGSVSNLITTNSRISLRRYQNHLESIGWEFKDTAGGVKGEAYETARKIAYAKIQQLKKTK